MAAASCAAPDRPSRAYRLDPRIHSVHTTNGRASPGSCRSRGATVASATRLAALARPTALSPLCLSAAARRMARPRPAESGASDSRHCAPSRLATCTT
eukprot:scaffold67458_cov36-Phaeocystis_antarctica.AAC.2